MMAITTKPNWSLAIGIPLIIFSACFLITFTKSYQVNQQLISNAIIGDLLITAPLAYLLLIRKSNVSKFTVIRIFIIGVIVSGLILNTHSNNLLHFIKTWVSPFIEATIIFFVVRKFYQANKSAKLSGSCHPDFLSHCRMVMHEVTSNEKAGNIISSEIAVFYYAFIAGKETQIDNRSKFTSYRGNGIILILFTILGLFLIETMGVHFLISNWSKSAAWIITGLSIYTCLQLYAHIRAIKARPITMNYNSIGIHNGLAGDAYIQFTNIEKYELSGKMPVGRKAIKISLLKTMEGHNCVVYLKQPIRVTKIFGIRKWADAVLFLVDDPKDFILALELKLTDFSNKNS